jgi:hypothetical protein
MKTKNQPDRSIEKSLKASAHRVIVVGTGIHHQILGDVTSPLCSWSELLKQVSENFAKCEICGKSNVNNDFVFTNDPVLDWENMVCYLGNLCCNDKLGIKAVKVERKLKELSCKKLKEISKDKIEIYQKNNFIAGKLENSSIHLLSLNFESLAYGILKPKKRTIAKGRGEIFDLTSNEYVRKSDAKLLYDRFICKNHSNHSTVWHPHGHAGRVDSLVLGMRDYGFLPLSYFYAFNQFKKWENEIAKNLQGAEKYQKLIEELKLFDDRSDSSSVIHPADNWVTRFMLYPVTFIGVGLSQVEIGMRWLLVQRARNFLRVPKDQMPITEYYGPNDPGIPGLVWKMPDNYDQMWKSALEP